MDAAPSGSAESMRRAKGQVEWGRGAVRFFGVGGVVEEVSGVIGECGDVFGWGRGVGRAGWERYRWRSERFVGESRMFGSQVLSRVLECLADFLVEI